MTDIASLIHKFLKDELNEGEMLELQAWRQQSDVNNRIFEKLTSDYIVTAVGDAYKIDSDEVAQQKINALIDQDQQATAHLPGTNRITLRSIWPRLSVAAAILLLLAVSAIYILKRNHQPATVVAETKKAKPDIAPGTYKATLTLADGSVVSIDSASNAVISRQGSIAVKNNNGQLVYDAKGAGSVPAKGDAEMLYNTVSTAKGQTYPVLLSDNSRVWLNSESSIRFPVAFVSGERKVQITGEVYFEVAHDASKPFIASVNGVDIQVLGTKFNINAYNDEEAIKTTLIEGSVRVSKGAQKKQIKPGQQAQVISNDIKVVDNVDLDKITAWKQGLFAFKGDKLEDVMKDLARWYNIDVVYEGTGTQDVEITGNIFRNWNLSEVLKILSTLNIESRIEGRKLILKAQ